MLNKEDLKVLKQANGILKMLLTDELMSQMTEQQIKDVKEAITESDPEKIRENAQQLIDLNKRY
jgi:hypothetical protein